MYLITTLFPVYAKLSHAGNGRAKVQLTGEINDGHDYSTDTDTTVVEFEITGSFLEQLIETCESTFVQMMVVGVS